MQHKAVSLAFSLSLSEWSVRRCSDYASLQMDASVNSALAEMLITIIYSLKYEEGELLSHDKNMLFCHITKMDTERSQLSGATQCWSWGNVYLNRSNEDARRHIHKDTNTPLHQFLSIQMLQNNIKWHIWERNKTFSENSCRMELYFIYQHVTHTCSHIAFTGKLTT